VLDEKFVAAHTRVFKEDKSYSREVTPAELLKT
jgi:hypothetical protein